MKFLTDVHNHSTFSHDGVDALKAMLQTAQAKGTAFYGVSEHFDYEVYLHTGDPAKMGVDAEAYFHNARRLQEDYAGCMNVLVGGEFGYAPGKRVAAMYAETAEKYKPDFIVNSVHCICGEDYYDQTPFYKTDERGNRVLRPKREAYGEYLALIRESLDADYPYDIVGHLGYAARYAPYGDKTLRYAEFGEQLDDILKTVVRKNKILEANASTQGLSDVSVPSEEILAEYYALGGRNVSYASDAHSTVSVLRRREEIVKTLKKIGFTYLTVPCKGEYIRVEI